MHSIVKTTAFIVTFTVGSGAVGLCALCNDLLLYHHNRRGLALLEQDKDSLRSLNAVHDAVLERIDSDPNMIRRIAPAVLGLKPEDPNAYYPSAGSRELAAAKQTLSRHDRSKPSIPALPAWLVRVSEPRRRAALFLAGGVLVLVSFACFGMIRTEPGRVRSKALS